MKKQLSTFVYSVLLLSVFNSCQFVPSPEDQSKYFKITNVSGEPLKEASGGTDIKLVSPIFKSLNANGQLAKHGKILIDGKEVPIKEVQGDIVLLTLPLMYYIDPSLLRFGLLYNNTIYDLCPACLLYTPTVGGSVFAGIAEGGSDGTFNLPGAMTNDAAGNVYLIDQNTSTTHDRVLKVTSTGITTVFAGSTSEFGRLVGISIDESRGLLYVADATSQQIKSIMLTSPSTTNVLAGSGTAGNTDGTGTGATFNFGNVRVDNFSSPITGQGLAIDVDGNLYVGENLISVPLGSQLRKCTPSGVVTTILASRIEPMSQEESAVPSALTIKNDNTIFYCSGTSGFFQGITQITSSGVVSRLAGKTSYETLNDGPGARAEFAYPKAIKYFGDYLYVADGTNGALRRVNSTGGVITLAGVGHFDTPSFCACPYTAPTSGVYSMPSPFLSEEAYYSETELRARQIIMDQVGGVTVVNRNLIYVSDYGYSCIWKITIW